MIAEESADSRLETLEGVIERGLQTFVEVGNALDEINRDGLYKATHATFEAYCKERWGLSRKRSYDFIAAARVVDNVSPMGDIVPITERQARPLTILKPEEQREAWAKAVDTAPNGKVTGQHVSTVVRDLFPRELPTQPLEPAESEGDTQEEEGNTLARLLPNPLCCQTTDRSFLRLTGQECVRKLKLFRCTTVAQVCKSGSKV